jgi:ATP-binding cassette subfamily B (MDR/TAP) protein 1
LANTSDKYLIALGIVVGLFSGLSYPLFVYIWGKEVDAYADPNNSIDDIVQICLRYLLYFFIIGICSLAINGVSFWIWVWISESLAVRCREKFIESILTQEVEWHESRNQYEISSRFKIAALDFQKATGDKIALLLNLIGMVVAGTSSCLAIRWTFSLFLIALLPVALTIIIFFLKVTIEKKISSVEFYKKADSDAAQATTMIKTVKMLNGENFEAAKYYKNLDELAEKNKHFAKIGGISTGLFFFIQYCLFGVGFLYGTHCLTGTSSCPISITGSHYTPGEIVVCFFEIFICTFSVMQLASNFEAIKNGIMAAG